MNPSYNKKGSNQERYSLHVPGYYPELCGEICIISGKYSHPFIRKGVNKIECPDEEKRYSDYQEKAIVQFVPTIPGDDKDNTGDDDTEKFRNDMKKKITILHRKGDCENEYQNGQNENFFMIICQSHDPSVKYTI